MKPFLAVPDLGLTDLLDILLVAVIVYAVAVAFRRTKAAFILVGILIFGAFFLLARVVGLRLTTFLFQGFFAAILVALVVIFQEELRRFLERVAIGSLRRGRKRSRDDTQPHLGVIAQVLNDLARDRIGAILVVEGGDPLGRHLQGEQRLDAAVSEGLLKSLFDPHSIGHDGAVIISGDRAASFSSHLPLSKDVDQLAGRGTRHAAALGLAERTDALCLVASEERGTISAARDGRLEGVEDLAHLLALLESFSREKRPRQGPRRGWRQDLGLKLACVLISALLWFLFVHESRVEYRGFQVAAQPASLPAELQLSAVSPPEVEVIVSAPRRTFYFVDRRQIRLSVNLLGARPGEQVVTLNAANLSLPDGVTFVNIVPRQIVFTVSARTPE